MRKLRKRVSSLLFASLIAANLTGKANAENDDVVLPSSAPTELLEPGAENAVPAPGDMGAAAETAGEGENLPKVDTPAPEPEEMSTPTEAADEPESGSSSEVPEAAPDQIPAEALTPKAAAEEEGASSAATSGEAAALPPSEPAGEEAGESEGETPAAAANEFLGEMTTEPNLFSSAYVGTRNLRASATDDSGTSSQGSSGETAAEGWMLVGNVGTKAISSKTDITIRTAGFQHISSLFSDGDVSIIGTGILLVDEIDMLEGCGIYLQSIEKIYGENGGTAALFVLTGEENGVKTYTLFNGTYSDGEGEHVIPAILDEVYEIPAGISLVVPDGGKLVMQSVNAMVETLGDQTFITYSTYNDPERQHADEGADWECIGTAPVLTVAEGARLLIEQGASFLLNKAEHGTGSNYNTPDLIVRGLLELYDQIVGGFIHIGSTGDVKGTGYFEKSESVYVDGDRETPVTMLNVSNTVVRLETADGDIGRLNTSGDVTMRYLEKFSIGSIYVKDGSLRISNNYLPDTKTLTIGQTISGGNGAEIILESGDILLTGTDACTVPIIDEYSYREVFWNGERLPEDPVDWTYLGSARTAEGGTLRYVNGALQSAPLIPLKGEVERSGDTISIPVVYGNYREHSHAYALGSYSEFNDVERAVDNEGEPISFPCTSDTEISYSILGDLYGTSYSLTGYKDTNYTYFLVTQVDGAYGYAILPYGSSQTVNASEVVQICRMRTFGEGEPAGGSSATAVNTSFTGSGILGGSGAGSVSGGSRRLALTGTRSYAPDPGPDPGPAPEPEPEPAPEPDPEPKPEQEKYADELRIWTEAPVQPDGSYILHIEQGGKALDRLDSPVTVYMDYVPGAEMAGKPLFVVFRDADGALVAFEASYDPAMEKLRFSTDLTGKFVVVAFDYDGELFSEAFYDELAKLDAVMVLFV